MPEHGAESAEIEPSFRHPTLRAATGGCFLLRSWNHSSYNHPAFDVTSTGKCYSNGLGSTLHLAHAPRQKPPIRDLSRFFDSHHPTVILVEVGLDCGRQDDILLSSCCETSSPSKKKSSVIWSVPRSALTRMMTQSAPIIL